MIRIYMGLPSTGNTASAQMHRLRQIQEKYGDRVEFVYPENLCFRVFHDFARNMIVEEFLKSDCDVLWMLDADVTPPVPVLDIILDDYDSWQAAGATYPVWMADKIVFVTYEAYPGKPGWLKMAPVPTNRKGKVFVDGLATGCIFLKREVFEKLEKPYFEFEFDKETREMKKGEDLGFCMKLHALKIPFLTDHSIVCNHLKSVNLLNVNNYTIDYANEKVMQYDAEIRGKVQQLAHELQQARKELAVARAATGQMQQTKSGLILPGK